MNKSIELLKEIKEVSSEDTPEFLAFVKEFKREFTLELKSINATEIQFSKSHFFISGFFKKANQYYYFSIDAFGGNYKLPNLLFRTCRDKKDFQGGHNNYIPLYKGMAKDMNLL